MKWFEYGFFAQISWFLCIFQRKSIEMLLKWTYFQFIQQDNDSATAKFLHYRTKYDDASFFKFILEGRDTKAFYYNIEIFE